MLPVTCPRKHKGRKLWQVYWAIAPKRRGALRHLALHVGCLEKVPNTPLKINMEHVLMEVRFRSFSLLTGWFVGEPAVNLPGCHVLPNGGAKWWFYLGKNPSKITNSTNPKGGQKDSAESDFFQVLTVKVPGVGGSWFPFFCSPPTGDIKQWGSRIMYLV